MILIIYLIIIIIAIEYIRYSQNSKKVTKPFKNSTTFTNKNTLKIKENLMNYTQCTKYKVKKRLVDIFKQHGITRNNSNWDLYLPCGYTNVEKELITINPIKEDQYVFAIDGCDKIVSKFGLWKTLLNRFGSDYKKYIPVTYGNNVRDLQLLVANHIPGKKYIAKKDIQQQKGLVIIHDINELVEHTKSKKVRVIQELLNDPFLVNNHKINLRIYLLIVCKNNQVNAYIHQNGFIYYAPKKFNYMSTDKDVHITTGYIDRKIYDKNPLSIDDFNTYLLNNRYDLTNFQKNIVELFTNILTALQIPVCNNSKFKNGTAFQLFGCDIAPDKNLGVKLIEINKGPDLDAKSERDNQIKNEVSLDLLETVGLIQQGNKNNRFLKIL